MTDGFTFYQILIIAVAIYNILRGIIKVANKKKTFRELVVLSVFWFFFSLLALYPHLSGTLADIIGFELGINALLVAVSIFLFFSVLKQSIINDNTENTITRLVRAHALKKLKK